MNKKLNTTAVEYQYRVRQQAKARTQRFREEQEKRGYKNLTVYLSEPFRAELEKLSNEKGFNRQDAMDHIFEIYQQTVNGCVTSNVTLNSDKSVENTVNVEPLKALEEKAENKAEKIEEPPPANEPPAAIPKKKVIETDLDLFPKNNDRPEVGTDEYTEWYYGAIIDLKKTMSYKKMHKYMVKNNIVGPSGNIVKQTSLSSRVRDAKDYFKNKK